MFYETIENKHGLKHDPFKALIVPRPIGWVTTMSHKGEINLAPYSYFNAFNSSPGVIGFSSEGRKDSVAFAEETREFVWNLATYSLRDPMNETSAPLPRGVSEFDPAGLETEGSRLVKPPRIKGVAAALECKWLQTLEIKERLGERVAIVDYDELAADRNRLLPALCRFASVECDTRVLRHLHGKSVRKGALLRWEQTIVDELGLPAYRRARSAATLSFRHA